MESHIKFCRKSVRLLNIFRLFTKKLTYKVFSPGVDNFLSPAKGLHCIIKTKIKHKIKTYHEVSTKQYKIVERNNKVAQ